MLGKTLVKSVKSKGFASFSWFLSERPRVKSDLSKQNEAYLWHSVLVVGSVKIRPWRKQPGDQKDKFLLVYHCSELHHNVFWMAEFVWATQGHCSQEKLMLDSHGISLLSGNRQIIDVLF